MAYYTQTWKEVKLKQVSYPRGAAAIGSRADSKWFQRLLLNAGKRRQKLNQYNLMDQTVDITRALDIIAEDISSDGADDDLMFVLDYPDSVEPKKTELKTLDSMLNLWIKKTEFDYRFFDFIREMLKNGIIIFKKEKDGELTKLVPERIVGYSWDEEDDSTVTHYVYNPKLQYTNKNGDVIGKQGSIGSNEQKEILAVEDLLILKIGEGPYGEPVLDNVFRVWKQLVLLEDAVVIYRIVRAPERRVFYIDIGKIPGHKAEAYIERIKNKMRQKQVNRDGTIETDYNPASLQEDYFIGQTGDGKGSRVETLPGGENLGRIEDLQYFNKKLALGLRIPPSYLERQGDDNNGPAYNDGRVGTAYMAELRYVGYIRRLQKSISKTLFANLKLFLKMRDVESSEELQFKISPPQSFAVYKENELASILLNTYGSAESSDTIAKKYAMQKYLDMNKEEIALNEDLKLEEMGLSPKEIKKLEDHERSHIVYGGGQFDHEEKDVVMGGPQQFNQNNGEESDSDEEPAPAPDEEPASKEDEDDDKKENGKDKKEEKSKE